MDCEDKKVCKIDDGRLAAYQQRTRSGSEQIFYTGNDERDFDRYRTEGGTRNANVKMHDKPDTIRLQPPEKHCYAQLIDGEWWWVNGCPECNGKEPIFAYVKCEKHDVCLVCKTPRGELKEAPWGHRRGFTCKPCHNAKHEADKQEALEAFAEAGHDDFDFHFNDKVVCPHCAYSYTPDDMHEDTEVECERCDGTYNVELEYSVTYSTEIVGDRVKV